MNDYEGFNTSLEEVSADVVETVREVEWEVELEAVTELLQFHNKTLIDEELLQMSKEGAWDLESKYFVSGTVESAPGWEHRQLGHF